MNNTKKKRVLLVDDNPSILEILSMMLRSENLEIETANDGAAALDLITNELKGNFDICQLSLKRDHLILNFFTNFSHHFPHHNF